VQTRGDMRGEGIGAKMIDCVAEAKGRGLSRVQLISSAKRVGAYRFYEKLGSAPSHLGFLMVLK
jgi:ribosomal protein S18 acetylase RimI-like enzyme